MSGLSCFGNGQGEDFFKHFNLIVVLAANQILDAISLKRFAAGPPASTNSEIQAVASSGGGNAFTKKLLGMKLRRELLSMGFARKLLSM